MGDSFTSLLSGGLINTNVPNYSGMARRSEARKQGIINLGLDQINAVFGGGSAPFYSAANTGDNKFDKHGTYYSLNKKGAFVPYWAPGGVQPDQGPFVPGLGTTVMRTSPISPLSWGGAGNILGHDRESPREVAKKQFNRGQLFTAPNTQTFEGFQQPFYDQRAQDYVNYAMPQLGEQYRGTRDAIGFGLANRGLTGSSQEAKANSALEQQTGRARQQISDEGLNQANTLKRGVEDARQQAINQLYQSADPAQALQGAVRSALNFQQPSTFAPISNMFTNIAQQYATNQLLNSYRQPFGITGNDALSHYLAPV